MTKLERLQLEIEIQELMSDRLDYIKLGYLDKIGECSEKIRVLTNKLLFGVTALPKEAFGDSDDIYISKETEMTDEQFSAFDEDGEPLEENPAAKLKKVFEDVKAFNKKLMEYHKEIKNTKGLSITDPQEKRNPLDRY